MINQSINYLKTFWVSFAMIITKQAVFFFFLLVIFHYNLDFSLTFNALQDLARVTCMDSLIKHGGKEWIRTKPRSVVLIVTDAIALSISKLGV